MGYVVVVGGANMDICGRPEGPLVPGDSNLGTVRLSAGGVGRNIAHNLALLGVDVRLVTAFGDDAHAAALRATCAEAGVDVTASLTVAGGATSTYLYVTDDAGEMRVAINDMAILEELTPAALAERRGLLAGAEAVVLDTNIPEASVAWLATNASAPLFCDPISTAKAERVRAHLGALHVLKPNRLQAQVLTGVDASDEWGASRAADELLATGLDQAFVSLGADGLLCAEAGRSLRLPPLPSHVVDVTGAGDAMTAALVWAHLSGLGLAEAGLAGLAASALAVESPGTVSAHLSERALLKRMRAARGADAL